jgi:S1-C subfamily serine protease
LDATVVADLSGVQSAVVRIVSEGDFVQPGQDTAVETGTGSGFFVSSDGLVLTANHVVAGADRITLYRAGDPTPMPATVVASSECFDLAVLDSGLVDTPYLAWRTEPWTVGTHVYAAGYPDGDPRFTLSDGIVARDMAAEASPWSSIEQELEHTAPIRPGSSGGPLVDDTGAVLGVGYAGTGSGRYLAIGAPEASTIAARLEEGTSVASIGLNGEAFAPELGLRGIFVYSVAPASPASRAGVEAGDVVRSIDGQRVGTDGTMAAYCEAIRAFAPGDRVPISVLRDGVRLDGQLGGQPLQAMSSAPRPAPGAIPPTARALRQELRASIPTVTGCQAWTESQVANDPFKHGSRAAILCEDPGPGVDYVALYRFDRTAAMDRYWRQRLSKVTPAVRTLSTACQSGAPGLRSWRYGELACWISPDSGLGALRWTDERTNTYGILTAADEPGWRKDLANL